MIVTQEGGVVKLDIHGETAQSAYKQITKWLSHAPKNVKEVRVIHGYHGGTVLQEMVRRDLKHPLIAAKLVALNPGETRLLLKEGG